MAVIEGGVSGIVQEVGEALSKPAHVTSKPVPYGALGHYQLSILSGNIAAGIGAAANVWSLRWTDTTRVALIHKVILTGVRTTTAFAAGTVDFNLFQVHTFTTDFTTNSTASTLTAPSGKLRAATMGATLMNSVRICTTAAMTGHTMTAFTHPVGSITTHSSAGTQVAAPIIGSTYLPFVTLFEHDMASGEHPIVLKADSVATGAEGLVFQCTVPATGVWSFGMTVKWSEHDLF